MFQSCEKMLIFLIWSWQIQRFLLLLTVKDSAMDIPENLDARRRISFFATSLFMDMPDAPKVRNMMSFRFALHNFPSVKYIDSLDQQLMINTLVAVSWHRIIRRILTFQPRNYIPQTPACQSSFICRRFFQVKSMFILIDECFLWSCFKIF